MTPLEKIKECQDIVILINSILLKHGIKESLTVSDITITNETVSDLVKQNSKLSNLLTTFLWPSITSLRVYHYTSRESAENILKSKIFKLSNIKHRFNDDEVKIFCETHSLKGYLENDKTGKPAYENLMSNIYYASFTSVNLSKGQEEYFWRNFAQCDGVRFTIDVTATNPDFRPIYYEEIKNKPIEIINDLTDQIYKKFNKKFIFKGLSRLCAFYLSKEDYGMENEYRILHRNWENSSPSHIDLPLNEMAFGYKLNIVDIHAIEKPETPNNYLFSKRTPN